MSGKSQRKSSNEANIDDLPYPKRIKVEDGGQLLGNDLVRNEEILIGDGQIDGQKEAFEVVPFDRNDSGESDIDEDRDPFRSVLADLKLLIDRGVSLREMLLRVGVDIDDTRLETLKIEDIANFLVHDLFDEYRVKLPHVNTMDDFLILLDQSHRIVVISGAGISTSCGIPDFRSENGLYNIIKDMGIDLPDPQLVFDKNFFMRDPRPFFRVSKSLFNSNEAFIPSRTHEFIQLLDLKNKLLRNYTQNIDNLEQKAGVTSLIQCHGSYSNASCLVCGYTVGMDEILPNLMEGTVSFCPKCEKFTGTFPIEDPSIIPPVMKPSIVFFGEQLPEMFHRNFPVDLASADLVIVIGSSMKVAPVNRFPKYLRPNTPLILINREIVGYPTNFDIHFLGDCDAVTSELMAKLGWDNIDNNQIEQISSGSCPNEFHDSPPTGHILEPYLFHAPNNYLFRNANFEVPIITQSNDNSDGIVTENDESGFSPFDGSEMNGSIEDQSGYDSDINSEFSNGFQSIFGHTRQ